MKTKRELRQEAVERLGRLHGVITTLDIVNALTNNRGGHWIDMIIGLLTDDEHLTEDDYLELLKDAAGDCERIRAYYKGLLRACNRFCESNYMQLPRDANGEVIHIGDEMVVGDHRYIVDGVGLADSTEVFFVTDGDKSEGFPAKVCRHYHKPTVEDVLREFAHVGIRIGAENGIQLGKVNLYADEEMVEKFAKKLQLKEDE